MLVRKGCHLCDEALAVAARVCSSLGVSYATLDVDSDHSLRDSYTDHVPVTFVDGQRVSIWVLDEETLLRALR